MVACNDCRYFGSGPVYGSVMCQKKGHLIPAIQVDVNRTCEEFRSESKAENFLSMKESRDGLKQLASDAKSVWNGSTRFGFEDIMKIIVVCAVAGFAFGLGVKIITNAFGGF